jgi:hypothetical protein
MVWALIEPRGFGDFFPECDPRNSYPGWKERLTEYYNTKMPPEEKAHYAEWGVHSYTSSVAHKFTQEIGTKYGSATTIRPFEPHEGPMWYEAKKSYRNLGSLIETTDRLLAVDELLKNIIEQLDPGVHHFWRMTITMPKGAVYPKPYYGMIIGRFINSFSPENSDSTCFRKEENYDTYFVRTSLLKYHAGLAFSAASIGAAHLWRERRLRNPNVCLSDRLQSEIKQAGLRVPKLIRMQEV